MLLPNLLMVNGPTSGIIIFWKAVLKFSFYFFLTFCACTGPALSALRIQANVVASRTKNVSFRYAVPSYSSFYLDPFFLSELVGQSSYFFHLKFLNGRKFCYNSRHSSVSGQKYAVIRFFLFQNHPT